MKCSTRQTQSTACPTTPATRTTTPATHATPHAALHSAQTSNSQFTKPCVADCLQTACVGDCPGRSCSVRRGVAETNPNTAAYPVTCSPESYDLYRRGPLPVTNVSESRNRGSNINNDKKGINWNRNQINFV